MASNAHSPASGARLDAYLVSSGQARSRQSASEAIRAGRVQVNGVVTNKPATRVGEADEVTIDGPSDHYVSRAAHKLAGALDHFGVNPRGRTCVDVGASTGGFTQVLLERGATGVTSIDVGTDQLVRQLREDPRVTSLEGTHITRDDLSMIAPADIVVADLSFISLRQVMEQMTSLVRDGGVLLPMVKPQFEVGRSRLGKGGVVTDPALQRDAVCAVIVEASRCGFGCVDIAPSQLPGPAGNREYFIKLLRGAPTADVEKLWAQHVAAP